MRAFVFILPYLPELHWFVWVLSIFFGSIELVLDVLKLLWGEAAVDGAVEQLSIEEWLLKRVVNGDTVGSQSVSWFLLVLVLLIDRAVAKVVADCSMFKVPTVYILFKGHSSLPILLLQHFEWRLGGYNHPAIIIIEFSSHSSRPASN
jgi:hypothetical protein